MISQRNEIMYRYELATRAKRETPRQLINM